VNGRVALNKLPLVVDAAMVISLLSLSYWIGVEANRVETVARDVQYLQSQVATLTQSSLSSDMAATKVKDEAQDRMLAELKTDLVARLERIERKIDRK
jgi:hypothetical protein